MVLWSLHAHSDAMAGHLYHKDVAGPDSSGGFLSLLFALVLPYELFGLLIKM